MGRKTKSSSWNASRIGVLGYCRYFTCSTRS